MPFCSKSLTHSLTDAKSLNHVCHRVLYMHGHGLSYLLNIYNIQWRTKLSSRFQEFICIISRLLWLSLRTLWGAANKYRACFTSKHEHNWVFPALGWRLAGFWLVSHLFSVYAEEASFFWELQSINLSNYVGNSRLALSRNEKQKCKPFNTEGLESGKWKKINIQKPFPRIRSVKYFKCEILGKTVYLNL